MPLAERPLGYETRFGRGFISGVFSVALAALGFGGVLCLRFPSFLTTPDARALYPLDLIR
ncbi:MAG: sterol desaturase, partial [Candidatus Rokuibacteriota bacterium]